MYCKYFTAYTMGLDNTDFLPWNLQVNIWTEFLSNFGILGIMIAILFICIVTKISEKSGNILIYLFGTIFIMFYLAFGFETFTLIAYIAWLVGIMFQNFTKGFGIKLFK